LGWLGLAWLAWLAFAQKYRKTTGFIVCSLKVVEKPLVLLWCRSKVLKNN